MLSIVKGMLDSKKVKCPNFFLFLSSVLTSVEFVWHVEEPNQVFAVI